MALSKKARSWLIVISCLFAVFGGLAFLIGGDYAKTASGGKAMDWAGGILLGAFTLTFLIWFLTSPGRKKT